MFEQIKLKGAWGKLETKFVFRDSQNILEKL